MSTNVSQRDVDSIINQQIALIASLAISLLTPGAVITSVKTRSPMTNITVSIRGEDEDREQFRLLYNTYIQELTDQINQKFVQEMKEDVLELLTFNNNHNEEWIMITPTLRRHMYYLDHTTIIFAKLLERDNNPLAPKRMYSRRHSKSNLSILDDNITTI